MQITYNFFSCIKGVGDFDYGHTLDADTIRISMILQFFEGSGVNGVRDSEKLSSALLMEYANK